MAKTITREQYDRLRELIADARALGAIQDRLVQLAEDITEDWEVNGWTFDACNNDDRATVDSLLAKLGITVEEPASTSGCLPFVSGFVQCRSSTSWTRVVC